MPFASCLSTRLTKIVHVDKLALEIRPISLKAFFIAVKRGDVKSLNLLK